MSYRLYSTLGCHLCEQAKPLVESVLGPSGEAWREVDIVESEQLVERYGVRIPVLHNVQSGEELGWPFDLPQLQAWLLRQTSDDSEPTADRSA